MNAGLVNLMQRQDALDAVSWLSLFDFYVLTSLSKAIRPMSS